MSTKGREASSVAQQVKTLLATQETQETQIRSLGREEPLEEGMATHSRTLAWRTPKTEEACRLWSMGLQSWTQLKPMSTHMHKGREGVFRVENEWERSQRVGGRRTNPACRNSKHR